MTMFDNNNKDNILVLYDGESRPGLFEEAIPEYSDEQRLQSITNKLNIPVVFKNVVGVAEVAKVSFRATMPDGITPIPDTANVYIVSENGDIIPVSTISSFGGIHNNWLPLYCFRHLGPCTRVRLELKIEDIKKSIVETGF